MFHHLRSDTTLDQKFAILHVDQAVELVLKARVLAFKVSIYKPNNTKETISIYEAYRILEGKGCKFPERPNLELLHDERNSIQHKYASPDAKTTAFHMENSLKFFRRFLRTEFGLKLGDYIPQEHIRDVLGA